MDTTRRGPRAEDDAAPTAEHGGAREAGTAGISSSSPRGAGAGGSLLGWASSVSAGAVSRRIQRRKADHADQAAGEQGAEQEGAPKGQHVKWTWPSPSLMTDAQREAADRARSDNHARLGDDSRRIVQLLVGGSPTGFLADTDLKAIAQLQKSHGRAHPDAVVDDFTLHLLFAKGVAEQRHDELIHLVGHFYGIRRPGRLHSLRFDPALTKDADVPGSEGSSDFGKVGPSAFASVGALQKALRQIASGKETAATEIDPADVPTKLSDKDADSAAMANARILPDPRAVRAVQLVLDSKCPVSGSFDHVTAQFVASFQADPARALEVTGIIDTPTFLALFAILKEQTLFQSALRLVIAYQHLPEAGVLDVLFDASLSSGFERGDDSGPHRMTPGAPVTLTFGPPTFAGPAEDNIHAIARAFLDVKLTRDPAEKVSFGERIFREIRLEVESRNMPEEEFGDTSEGFLSDARRALLIWGDLSNEEKSRNWKRFTELREAVRDRFKRAEGWQRAVGEQILADYNKVSEPPRVPPTKKP